MKIPELNYFENIHAHGCTGAHVLTNLDRGEEPRGNIGSAWYSVGIHPWATENGIDGEVWKRLERMVSDPRVAAIGEAGLDDLRGGDSSVQEDVFIRQVELSERLEKPLIVHCVRRYGRLMELRRMLEPKQRWIVHGFTGKPELARQLLAAGMDISFGERFNPKSVAVVPPERRFYETDMSNKTLDDIRRHIEDTQKELPQGN